MEITSKRFLDSLLLTVIVIFSALSAYTTKVGFALVWGGENNIVRELLAWGIAIGSSLFMIYLSVQVAEFIKERRMVRLLIGYLSIASLSVFFNFNAIHGRQEKGVALVDDASKLRQFIMDLRANSLKSIEANLGLSVLQRKADSLQMAMNLELTHNTRPGAGWRHQDLREKYGYAVTQVKAAERAFLPLKEQIDRISSSAIARLDSAIVNKRESQLILAINEGKKSFDKIIAETQAEVRGFKAPDLDFESLRVERPDYTFYSVLELLKSTFTGGTSLSQEDKARVYLSILLSIALDFPIFFCLVVLNWPRTSGSFWRFLKNPLFSTDEKKSKKTRIKPFIRRPDQQDSNLWD